MYVFFVKCFFRTARENLKNRSGENLSYPVLAFHGTAEGNIQPICESGFKVPGNIILEIYVPVAYKCRIYIMLSVPARNF